MILKAKGDYGQMPVSKSAKYGISPVDGKENKKVWPPGSKFFRIVKGESYNAKKQHPFFESKGGHKVSGDKVLHDDPTPPANKGQGSSDSL